MKKDVKVHDIVQLAPETQNPMFAGCMLVVTEVKAWGVQGYVQSLGEDGKPGGQAYYRPGWDEFELTGGSAEWTLHHPDDVGEGGTG